MGVELGAVAFPRGPFMLNDGAAHEGVQAVVGGSVLWQVRPLVKSERFPLALEQLDDVRGKNIKFVIF